MVRHGIENIIFVKITFSEEQEFLPLAHNNLTEILTNLGNVKIWNVILGTSTLAVISSVLSIHKIWLI